MMTLGRADWSFSKPYISFSIQGSNVTILEQTVSQICSIHRRPPSHFDWNAGTSINLNLKWVNIEDIDDYIMEALSDYQRQYYPRITGYNIDEIYMGQTSSCTILYVSYMDVTNEGVHYFITYAIMESSNGEGKCSSKTIESIDFVEYSGL